MLSYISNPRGTRESTLKHVIAWLYCQNGATAVEYGLLAGGISLTIVATVIIFGSDLKSVFVRLDSDISAGVASNIAAANGG